MGAVHVVFFVPFNMIFYDFVIISYPGHDIEQLIQESVAPGPWAVDPWNERPIWAYGPMSSLAQCPGSQGGGPWARGPGDGAWASDPGPWANGLMGP